MLTSIILIASRADLDGASAAVLNCRVSPLQERMCPGAAPGRISLATARNGDASECVMPNGVDGVYGGPRREARRFALALGDFAFCREGDASDIARGRPTNCGPQGTHLGVRRCRVSAPVEFLREFERLRAEGSELHRTIRARGQGKADTRIADAMGGSRPPSALGATAIRRLQLLGEMRSAVPATAQGASRVVAVYMVSEMRVLKGGPGGILFITGCPDGHWDFDVATFSDALGT